MTDGHELAARLDALPAHERALVERVIAGLNYQVRYGNPPRILGLPMCESDGSDAVATLEISEIHLNPHGIAHGMVGFGMLDNAMGQVATAAGDRLRPCVCTDVQIRFARALTPGTYQIRATPVRAGRRFAVVEGRISDEGGVRVLATSTYAYVDAEAGGVGATDEQRPWVARQTKETS